jgi:hypothetical protein
MALGSTKSLRNEYQESSWGKGRLVRKDDNLTAIFVPDCLQNMGASTSHNPMGLHGLLQGLALLFNY